MVQLKFPKIFVFVLVGIWLFNSSSAFAHSQIQIIQMTQNGFEPASITIDTNSSVIFVNKDTNPRWPASNIHPTHGIYPEFDPKKQIEPGKDWTFKPGKSGTFKFHDHLFPHFRGTLIIEEESGSKPAENKTPDSALNLLEKLKNTFSGFFKNITQFINAKKFKNIELLDLNKVSSDRQLETLEDFAKDAGAQKAWEAVQVSFKGQAGSSGNIHDLAHLSGNLLFEEKGFDGLAVCSTEFAFGCYHGFLDKAFSKNLDRLQDAQDACLKLGPGLSGPAASCIHGIGHGIASFYSTNDLKASLLECRKMTQGSEYCFDGVFMEFVRNAPESFFKKDNPLYPCDELEKNYGPSYSFSCGRNQPSLLMGRFKMGFDEVVSVCLSTKSKNFKQACFDSLGFFLASTQDAAQIIKGCQKIRDTEFTLRCAKSAAGELIFQEIPDWEEKSVTVCNAFPKGQEECNSNLERLINEYGRVKKITFKPIQTGEDPGSYLRHEIKKCYEGGGRDGCYNEAAKFFYNQLGFSQTLRLIKANEDYPEVYARCHEVTHYLSRFEYEKQKNIAKVYSQCDSTCHGGCYHGTLEAYLKEKQLNPETNLTSHFPTVCGKVQDYKKPIEFYECLHGMGHAAMFTQDMELKESLKLCDTLSEKGFIERCYSGVFMENSSSSTSNDHQGKYIKADDPFYPCNSLDEKYQPLCWQYQSSYFAIITNQDFKKVADLCLKIPDKYRDKCFKTIGTNQVGLTTSMQVMKDNCSKMPSVNFKNICVSGVISSLAYRFVDDLGKMINFCALVDQDSKESCFKQVGTALMDWNSDKTIAKKHCSEIHDNQGSSWCLSVI